MVCDSGVLVEGVYRVRCSTASDMEPLAAIYRHYVLETTTTFELDPPTPSEMDRRRLEVLGKGLPHLVAELGNEVIGCAYGRPYRTRSGYRYSVENSIYMHPKFVGMGLGKILLGELIAECERGSWRQMVAVIGGTENEASVRLLQGFGFRQVGILISVGYKFGRWIDTILMQRALGRGDTEVPDE